jgi:hypothetical protein
MPFSPAIVVLAALLVGTPQHFASANPAPITSANTSTVASASAACEVEQVRMTWGFAESFRRSLSGALALGQWTTTGDVGYDTPEFVFSGGVGHIAPDRKAGRIAFEGELRFVSVGGLVNTAFSHPRFEIVGEREAALFFDVTGGTVGGFEVSQPALNFVRITWPSSAEAIDSQTGLWSVTGARVVLTPLGAGALGTFFSGQVFDPLSFSIQVEPGCLTTGGFRWWWLPGGGLVLAMLGALGFGIATWVKKSREPEAP